MATGRRNPIEIDRNTGKVTVALELGGMGLGYYLKYGRYGASSVRDWGENLAEDIFDLVDSLSDQDKVYLQNLVD